MASEEQAKPARRKHGPRLSFYDIREMARTIMFLAGLAGLIMGDIWLAGKL